MTNFAANQIVNGKVAGTFVIIAFRNIGGVDGAQVKSVNPANHSQVARGELWMPLTKLEPLAA